MRIATLVLVVATLQAVDSIDVLMPGLSYHTSWEEAGSPNQFNYGLGLSITRARIEEGDWGQVQAGGMVYKDSYGEPAVVGFVGLGARAPTTWSAEALAGMSVWNGSGMQGAQPFWYCGVGYQTRRSSVFVDVTANTQVRAAWLKFSFPLPD